MRVNGTLLIEEAGSKLPSVVSGLKKHIKAMVPNTVANGLSGERNYWMVGN